MKEDKIQDNSTYNLKLFVAGNEPNSVNAKEIVGAVCETYLKDNFSLEVIDVYKNYQTALDHKVIVVPTLMVHSSQIKTTIVGSLNNTENLAKKLGLSLNINSHE